MSLKAIRWAFQRNMNDATAKAVLVALAEHVEDGRADCWPSAKRLGKYTALGERTVRAVVSRLTKMKAIDVEEREGKTPVYTLDFDWEGETEPRCRTPRSRKVQKALTPASDADVTPACHTGLPRRQTAATPASRAQTPASDADEPLRTPYEPIDHEAEIFEVPEGEDFEDGLATEGRNGFVRPPSDNRQRGQRQLSDVLERMLPKVGKPEKRRKRPDFADRDVLRVLTTLCGMDNAKAYAMVTAARNEDMEGHTESSRYLEKLSRQHRLGWFAEETV